MRRSLPLLLAVGCIFASLAFATPLDDKVAVLKDAMKKEDALKPPGATGSVPGRPEISEAALDQITSGVPGPYGNNTAQIFVSQILESYSSDEVRKAAQALLQEIRDEQKAKADAYTAEVQDVFKRLKEAANNDSAKASDFDPILVDLEKCRTSAPQNWPAGVPNFSQQLNDANQFAWGWQNYLVALASGNIDQARAEVSALAQNSFGVTLVPRSKILSLENDLAHPGNSRGTAKSATENDAAAGKILAGIKSLDEMEPALKQLEETDPSQRTPETNAAMQQLRENITVYHQITSGVPHNFNLASLFNQTAFQNAALDAKLTLLVLQTYFASYQGTPPAVGEKPAAFVDRVIADAQRREDWQLLRGAINVKGILEPNDNGAGSYSTNPIDSLLAGLNQEAAGQYVMAVASYEGALRSTSPFVPVKFIGAHLAAIQKDHPPDYAEGLEQPAVPMYGNPYARPIMPGYPLYRTFPQSTVINLPGVSSPPATPTGSGPSAAANPVPIVPIHSAATNATPSK